VHVELPHAFVAVQVTVVCPVGKVDPETGEQVTVPFVDVGFVHVAM